MTSIARTLIPIAAPRVVALAALALSCAAASPAWAQDRDYCPDRPGLGTSPCTIARGHVSVETGLADWQRDVTTDQVSDSVLLGDTLLRAGISRNVEIDWGWTPFGRLRVRDRHSGAIARSSAAGDMLLGIKANLRNPDGDGVSVALRPFVTIPVGRSPVGAGAWTAGLLVPASYDLGKGWSLGFSGEADAMPDTDGRGHHLAYSGVLGLGRELAPGLSGSVEFQAARDEDPAGGTTQALGALSLAWSPSRNLQLDIGGAAGLNAAAPRAELYVGIARRF